MRNIKLLDSGSGGHKFVLLYESEPEGGGGINFG
jgi:hypothetical protein